MDIMLERLFQLIGSKHGAKKELADAIGIPANVITDWRAGRNKSYPKYAPQIAEYYGVSLDWLSGLTNDKGTKKEKPATPEGGELMDTLIIGRDGKAIKRKYSKAQMDALWQVIQVMPYESEDDEF